MLRRCMYFFVAVVLSLTSQLSVAETIYGPPYGANDAYFANPKFDTVDEVVNYTWLTYQKYWRVSPYGGLQCHYERTDYPDGVTTGQFAGLQWAGDCGGGDGVFGTPITYNDKSSGAPACEASTKNPIAMGSGNKFLSDFDIESGGLRIQRSYNGKSTSSFFPYVAAVKVAGHGQVIPFGQGWISLYTQRISPPAASGKIAWAARQDGRIYTFKSSSAGIWVGDADVSDTLTELRDGAGTRTGWRYLDASNGQVEMYDASGVLKSIALRGGEVQTLIYTDGSDGSASGSGGFVLDASGASTEAALPAGLLLSVTDGFGHVLNFGYDASAHIIRIENGIQIVTYSYDASGNLGTVTYPDGSAKTYLYGESGYVANADTQTHVLTGIADENGARYASYWYDANGRAIAEELQGGADKAQLAFSVDGNQNVTSTQVTDARGAVRTYAFSTIQGVSRLSGVSQPGGSGCSASTSALTYDANGNVASRADFSNRKVCYANDLKRNLETARIEGLGGGDACPSDVAPATPSAPQRKVSTQWHPLWPLEARRAEPKLITSWIYNGQTDPTNNNAVASCAPSSATLPDGQPIAVLCKRVEQATTDETGASGFLATASGSARTWSYTYNLYGQMLTEVGPRTNDRSAYAYYTDTLFDDAGVGHTLGDLATQSNALGQVTRYSKYDKTGRLLERIDPDGVTNTQTWHARGWLTSTTRSATGLSETSSFDYDKVGQLIMATQADGSWAAFTYDGAHRLTDVSGSRGNYIHYTLDGVGNRTSEEVSDPSGALTRVTRRVFDALGRLQSVQVSGTAAGQGTGVLVPSHIDWVNAPAANVDAGIATSLKVKVSTDRGALVADAGSTNYGKVRFSDNGELLDSVAVDGGSGEAALSWVPSGAGAHTLTAYYSGNFVQLGSSLVGTSTVSRSVSKVGWSVSPPASSYADSPIELTALVSTGGGNAPLLCENYPNCGASGYGMLRFRDGANVLAEVAVGANGQASYRWRPAYGSHNVVAEYLGNGFYAPGQTSSAPIEVIRHATLTEWIDRPASILPGTSVTLSAKVSAPGLSALPCDTTQGCSSTGYGTVRLLDGDTALAELTLTASGLVSYSWMPTAAGAHTLSASYSGSALNQPSTASAVFTATQIPTVTTWNSAPPASFALGSTLRLAVTVAPQAGGYLRCDPTVKCSSTSYGKVRFLDGAAVLGEIDIGPTGKAEFDWTPSTLTGHMLTASYLGTVPNQMSSATANVQVMAGAATTTSWVSNPTDSVLVGSAAQSVVQVTRTPGSSCGAVPCSFGVVQILEGTQELGRAGADATGKATVLWAAATTGAHSVKARYIGSATDAASEVSAPVVVTMRPQVSTTATLGTVPANTTYTTTPDTPIPLAAQVFLPKGESWHPDPSGSYGAVAFYNGGITVCAASPINASGVAFCYWRPKSAGLNYISAQYLGTTSYSGSPAGQQTTTVTIK